MPVVEERVDKLEALAAQTQMMLQSLSYEVSRTQISVSSLSQEMRDFKVHIQSTVDNLSKNIDKLEKR
jgi:SMC interacting uncharacterized protein involved in chromosome segregation